MCNTFGVGMCRPGIDVVARRLVFAYEVHEFEASFPRERGKRISMLEWHQHQVINYALVIPNCIRKPITHNFEILELRYKALIGFINFTQNAVIDGVFMLFAAIT